MADHIPSGGFKIARKIFKSSIWTKDPEYLKLWLWIIGRASFGDHEKNGYEYRRGEFVTTYAGIIRALTYFHNKRKFSSSVKKVRIILQWLVSEGMILTNPLHSGRCRTGADTGACAGAYIGINIIVLNYDTYQDSENYKGRHRGTDFSAQGHNNNKGNNNGNNIPDFNSLKSRYPTPDLIDRVFGAIASTRKSGKVADSVLMAQLQKWEWYPVEQVESGIRTYLEKDHAGQGKDEKYLLGIIRHQNGQKPAPISRGRNPENPCHADWF